MADTAATPKTQKGKANGSGNMMWIIIVVIAFIGLGGINFYYMNKNKELKSQLAAKSTTSNNNGMGGDMENKEEDSVQPEKTVAG